MSDFLVWLRCLRRTSKLERRHWYRTQYLYTNHWQKFRKWRKYSWFARLMGWDRCADCGDPEEPLDLHHVSYEHLWWEQFHWFDVVTLCRVCRKKRHGWEQE